MTKSLKPVVFPDMGGLVRADLGRHKITFLRPPKWAATHCPGRES